MQYKDKPKPMSEIGRELNAGTILEGSVRKSGNRLRVSIQMIDAAEDKHLWAETYDREIKDIFAVQSDIAGRVAESLKVELLTPEKKEITQAPTKDVEAHALYLKGIYHSSKGSPVDIEKAIKYFELGFGARPQFRACPCDGRIMLHRDRRRVPPGVGRISQGEGVSNEGPCDQ